MRRVVLDTSVLVSALIGDGPPARLLHGVREGEFELVISPLLLGELERVLNRPKFRRYFSSRVVPEFIEGLHGDASHVPDPVDPPPFHCDDPKDDYLIALAFHQNTTLVSGDKHLLEIGGGAPIVAPADLVGQPA